MAKPLAKALIWLIDAMRVLREVLAAREKDFCPGGGIR